MPKAAMVLGSRQVSAYPAAAIAAAEAPLTRGTEAYMHAAAQALAQVAAEELRALSGNVV